MSWKQSSRETFTIYLSDHIFFPSKSAHILVMFSKVDSDIDLAHLLFLEETLDRIQISIQQHLFLVL